MKLLRRLKEKVVSNPGSRKFFLLAACAALPFTAVAQVNLTSLTPYTQNFDNLPASGNFVNESTLPGWSVDLGGQRAITTADGASTASGIRNFGAANGTDRALGGVTNSTTGDIYYSLKLKNTTGTDIKSFLVSYTAEEWRGMQREWWIFFYVSVYGSMDFEYRVGSGAWTAVSDLAVTGKVAGNNNSDQTVDGNLNNTVVNAAINLPAALANNQEITLRWRRPNTNASNYLAIDEVEITPLAGNVYYCKSSGGLNNPATWGTSTNGNGTQPSSLTLTNTTYIYANRSGNSNLPAVWNLGTNSKLIVAEGSLTIPANVPVNGTIDVINNASLTIQSINLPALATIGENSTINISNTSNVLPAHAYGNLVVSGTKKNLNGPVQVKSRLTLNSKVELGNFDLTLKNKSVIENASAANYIVTKGNGRLKQTVALANVLFPVGNEAQYLPITLANAGLEDEFSVKVIDSVYTAYTNNVPSGKSVRDYAFNKTWIIDEAQPAGSNVTISLEVKTGLVNGLLNTIGGLAGFDVTQAKIVHYENDKWDYAASLPTTLSSVLDSYTLTRSGITSFSPFSIMSGTPAALPVELISFSASRKENGVVCSWKTAQETNNDFFAVERSTNGRTFETVGTLKGKGTTSQAAAYTFTDLQAPASLVYYRLRQADFDGTTTYSSLVAVAAAKTKGLYATLAPNPTSGQVVLQAVTPQAEKVQISVWNTKGQLVLEKTVSAAALQTGYPIDLQQQANGIYLVKVVAGQEVVTLRAVKE